MYIYIGHGAFIFSISSCLPCCLLQHRRCSHCQCCIQFAEVSWVSIRPRSLACHLLADLCFGFTRRQNAPPSNKSLPMQRHEFSSSVARKCGHRDRAFRIQNVRTVFTKCGSLSSSECHYSRTPLILEIRIILIKWALLLPGTRKTKFFQEQSTYFFHRYRRWGSPLRCPVPLGDAPMYIQKDWKLK